MGASVRHGASASWPKTPGDTKANPCRAKALSVVSQDDADPCDACRPQHVAPAEAEPEQPRDRNDLREAAGVGDGLPRDQASPR